MVLELHVPTHLPVCGRADVCLLAMRMVSWTTHTQESSLHQFAWSARVCLTSTRNEQPGSCTLQVVARHTECRHLTWRQGCHALAFTLAPALSCCAGVCASPAYLTQPRCSQTQSLAALAAQAVQACCCWVGPVCWLCPRVEAALRCWALPQPVALLLQHTQGLMHGAAADTARMCTIRSLHDTRQKPTPLVLQTVSVCIRDRYFTCAYPYLRGQQARDASARAARRQSPRAPSQAVPLEALAQVHPPLLQGHGWLLLRC